MDPTGGRRGSLLGIKSPTGRAHQGAGSAPARCTSRQARRRQSPAIPKAMDAPEGMMVFLREAGGGGFYGSSSRLGTRMAFSPMKGSPLSACHKFLLIFAAV